MYINKFSPHIDDLEKCKKNISSFNVFTEQSEKDENFFNECSGCCKFKYDDGIAICEEFSLGS